MEKIFKKLTKYIISICLIICCSFSTSGCFGGDNGGGNSSGSSAGNSGTLSSNGGAGPSKDNKPEIEFDASEFEDDIAKNFLGAVCIYEVDGTKEVYYDTLQSKKISFNNLLDRQFDILARYLYLSLNGIYGTTKSNIALISGTGYNMGEVQISGALSQTQSVYAGLVGGEAVNKDKISYLHAINGDYEPQVIQDGSDYIIQYVSSGTSNPWKGKDYFNVSKIKDALKKIYYHLYIDQTLTKSSDIDVTTEDGKNALIQRFTPNSSDKKIETFFESLTNSQLDEINFTGFDEAYMSHVYYFLICTIVGVDNITNSFNNKTTLTQSEITINSTTLDSSVRNALINYKGYDEVLPSVVKGAFNLVKSSGSITYGTNYFTGENWSNTLYPSIDKNEYVFYDDLANISDAIEQEFNADEVEIPEADTSQKDFGDQDFSEYDTDDTLPGTAKRLKQIYFIPKLEDENGPTVDVNGVMCGFKNYPSNGLIGFKMGYKCCYNSDIKEEKTIEFSDTDGDGFTIENNIISLTNDANTGVLTGYFNYTGEKDEEEDSDVGDIEIPEADTSKKDFSGLEVEDETRNEDYTFGTVQHSVSGVSAEELFKNSFNIAEVTESTTDTKINYGTINTHNQLFKMNFERVGTTIGGVTTYNYSNYMTDVLTKNFFTISFAYADASGLLEKAPLIYLMSFEIIDL